MIYLLLGNITIIPDPEVDKADILEKLNYRTMITGSQQGQNINAMAALTELAGKFPNVDAHPSGVFGSKFPDGTGVYAEHGDV
jgi:hypothetical protein